MPMMLPFAEALAVSNVDGKTWPLGSTGSVRNIRLARATREEISRMVGDHFAYLVQTEVVNSHVGSQSSRQLRNCEPR